MSVVVVYHGLIYRSCQVTRLELLGMRLNEACRHFRCQSNEYVDKAASPGWSEVLHVDMALASFAYFGGRVQLSAGIPGTSLSPLDNDVLGSVLCEGSTASGTPALEPGIEADTNESDESEGDKDHDNIPGSSQLESDTDGTESGKHIDIGLYEVELTTTLQCSQFKPFK